jgi:amyloid beta precursor protein binding protein 1
MALFSDPALSTKAMDSNGSPFFHLLAALKEYAEQSDTHTLPLTSTLPDMKSDTHNYIHLQRLYKTRAEEEKRTFKSYLRVPVDDAIVDSFVKNAHALVVLRGKPWGTFDEDKAALGKTLGPCIGSNCLLSSVGLAESLSTTPKETCIHLALSALSLLQASDTSVSPSAESIRAKIQSIVGQSTELPDEADDAIGEM